MFSLFPNLVPGGIVWWRPFAQKGSSACIEVDLYKNRRILFYYWIAVVQGHRVSIWFWIILFKSICSTGASIHYRICTWGLRSSPCVTVRFKLRVFRTSCTPGARFRSLPQCAWRQGFKPSHPCSFPNLKQSWGRYYLPHWGVPCHTSPFVLITSPKTEQQRPLEFTLCAPSPRRLKKYLVAFA